VSLQEAKDKGWEFCTTDERNNGNEHFHSSRPESETHIVLVAKRLEKGGTMQPKNNLIRNGLYSILGEKKEMIVKVFLGPKNHGFVSVAGEDAKRIAEKINNIITLE
jgi:hypothetical protein